MGMKLLIGGSPCTHWSIAQKNNRETTAEGIGWELFKNFLIAKEKFRPDFFLYENNKSAAQPIKDQIAKEFGVTERNIFTQDNGVRMTYINSSLVSAQNRQRFYVTNFGDIEQPADRGILLRDILESGTSWREKSYCVDANYFKATDETDPFNGRQSGDRLQVAEPVGDTNGKAFCLTSNYPGAFPEHTLRKSVRSMVAEPVCVAQRGRYSDTGSRGKKTDAKIDQYYEAREDGKTNALTTVGKDNAVAEPIDFEYVDYTPRENSHIVINENSIRCSQDKNNASAAESFVNFTDVKMGTLTTAHVPKCIEPIECMPVREATKQGYTVIQPGDCVDMTQPNSKTKRGRNMDDKCNCLTTGMQYYQYCGTTKQPIYEVIDGYITIKDKQYPIKLADGYYIIRKLTVKECMRLQTVPPWYEMPCSASQNYKMLGNSWTVEVIMHLLNHIPNIRNEEIEVLSMYDGMSAGQIALKQMGCNVVKYTASEIDKYAIQTTQHNFPNTKQLGDAFAIRTDEWKGIVYD